MLTISGVSKRFSNGVYGIQDLSLDVEGGVLGLLGPNGAGKTTLMQMIATLTKPTAGRISFQGIDAARDPEAIRARLGYLPQDFGVYENLTAFEILDYLARLKGVRSKSRVLSMLEVVNLHAVAHRAVGTFSGGMRQRLGIAQALIGEPELLIVDEPTAGLDPDRSESFVKLIQSLHATLNLTVVMVTHDLDTLVSLSDKIAVLAEQKLIVYGTLREAIAVRHPFILNFFLGERGLRALSAVGASVKLDGKH